MATLKNLVDETTNIKNELKTCHTNLVNNLSAKGVEVSSGDKLSSLIDKVEKLGLDVTSQEGVYSMTKTIEDLSISQIDLSKSICMCLSSSGNYNDKAKVMCSFSNNSSITFRRYASGSNSVSVFWKVIQFNSGVRSVNNMLITESQLTYDARKGTYTHNLNLLNPSKCIVFYSFCSSNTGGKDATLDIGQITSNTIDIYTYTYTPTQMNLYIVELE